MRWGKRAGDRSERDAVRGERRPGRLARLAEKLD